jgi:hypothetical protein
MVALAAIVAACRLWPRAEVSGEAVLLPEAPEEIEDKCLTRCTAPSIQPVQAYADTGKSIIAGMRLLGYLLSILTLPM